MRMIPIASAAPITGDGCNEYDGQVPKLDLPLARREFLKGSGVLMGTLAAGSILATLAPSRAWALELKTLSKSDGETLMAMGRTLYPHKKLPDAVYALLAKDLDAKAAGSAADAKLLRDGIAGLDTAAGGNFIKASAAKKLEIVKSIEGTPFFNTVRGQCITSLYN
ncbi:MAG: twin-arginine translocation signal domain-containing protein, partial [Pseudomonadota bacterium]